MNRRRPSPNLHVDGATAADRFILIIRKELPGPNRKGSQAERSRDPNAGIAERHPALVPQSAPHAESPRRPPLDVPTLADAGFQVKAQRLPADGKLPG